MKLFSGIGSSRRCSPWSTGGSRVRRRQGCGPRYASDPRQQAAKGEWPHALPLACGVQIARVPGSFARETQTVERFPGSGTAFGRIFRKRKKGGSGRFDSGADSPGENQGPDRAGRQNRPQDGLARFKAQGRRHRTSQVAQDAGQPDTPKDMERSSDSTEPSCNRRFASTTAIPTSTPRFRPSNCA